MTPSNFLQDYMADVFFNANLGKETSGPVAQVADPYTGEPMEYGPTPPRGVRREMLEERYPGALERMRRIREGIYLPRV